METLVCHRTMHLNWYQRIALWLIRDEVEQAIWNEVHIATYWKREHAKVLERSVPLPPYARSN